jgi:membrane protease YdiL (CAAX protease family)
LSGEIQPWGRLATFGIAFVVMLVSQFAALLALTLWLGKNFGQMPDLGSDGVAVAIVILISIPIQVLLLAAFAQRRGHDALEYLGLIMPSRSEVIFGAVVTAAMIIVFNLLSWVLGKNIVTSFQTDIYRTAGDAGPLAMIMLWLAVIVVTPVGEEVMFRGFAFRGWLRSPRDAWAVIAITAGLWALIHLQYDWYVTGQIFAFGLMLGWLRWATGSTVLTILLHAMINFEGMLETVVASQWPT